MVRDAFVLSLAAWQSYYVIMGSSAAALTGLQFVVIALGAERRTAGTTEGIDAYVTPTTVHFATVLLLAAILTAPWRTHTGPALVLGACGIGGVGYAATVTWRARKLTSYQPVLEDWLWHSVLPLVAHATLLIASTILLATARHFTGALFMVGGAALLLLFIGIHNAWDIATYLTNQLPKSPETPPGTE